MIDDIQIIECSFLSFIWRFGLKNVRKQVLRILYRSIVERSKNTIVVAETSQSVIIGYAVARDTPRKYRFTDDESLFIGPIYVDNHHRNKGIAFSMVNHLTSTLKKSGGYYAYILDSNTASLATFSKCGFRRIGYMIKNRHAFSLSQEPSIHVVVHKEGVI